MTGTRDVEEKRRIDSIGSRWESGGHMACSISTKRMRKSTDREEGGEGSGGVDSRGDSRGDGRGGGSVEVACGSACAPSLCHDGGIESAECFGSI